MISQEDARARVANGAAYLDQVKPGWFNQIDTDTLTMINPCGCIVGQLCGDYNRDLKELLGRGADAFSLSQTYGFNLPLEWNEGQPTVAWLALQDAWVEAIAARKFPDAPARSTEPARTINAVDPVDGLVAMVHAR